MSEFLDNITNIEVIKPEVFCSLLLENNYIVQSLGKTSDGTEVVQVKAENIAKIATFLKMNKETRFDILYSVMGTDKPNYIEVIYDLYSSSYNKRLLLKAHLDKVNPEIQSVADVYSAADWHERETFDLLGIKFIDHPDLKRILLPEDWIGHPLKKDYKENDDRLVWNER